MSIHYLNPVGIIDAEVGSSLLFQIQSELNLNTSKFYIDCSDVQSVTEEGLTFLIQALKVISESQGYLSLISVNESVRSILASKGLDLIFDLIL